MYHLNRLNAAILQNPNVELCIVRWPYYQKYEEGELRGQVNGDILRILRFRAFFEFAHVPVFVRDADTLWALNISDIAKNLRVKEDFLYEWEANYLRGAVRLPNTFIFGSSIGYKKSWHVNQERKAPLGAFGGLQSTMPLVPCFQDLTVWERVVSYIRTRSVRTPSGIYTNESGVGKDEKILLFVLLPACIDHIFFFELDYMGKRSFTLKGKKYKNSNYALKVFERGDNANIRKLFRKAMETEFAENFEEERSALEVQNIALGKEMERRVKATLSLLKNTLDSKLKGSKLHSFPMYTFQPEYDPMGIAYEINSLAKERDEEGILQSKYDAFDAANRLYNKARKDFTESIRYENRNIPRERELALLQKLIDRRNTLLREFLETAFRFRSVEDYRVPLQKQYKKEYEKLLEWFRGLAGGKQKTRKVKRV
jgi:hypothetical protein